ncbi:MAG: hypothetical protein GPOALKHO_001163 [Sodalis sp.]|nr:MAG: hypothetical protein GPOALKHO_001163 [Sodalis sp.]
MACAIPEARLLWRALPIKTVPPTNFHQRSRDNAFLDHIQRNFGYAVFGEAVTGKVADKTAQVPIKNEAPHQNESVKPIDSIDA